MRAPIVLYAVFSLLASAVFAASAPGPEGYYRQPAIHGDVVVFVAEGDLWRVPVAGGRATRLTTHPGTEGFPAISPDGVTVAFTAEYEGPIEVYAMPLAGGLPTRLTFDDSRCAVSGFSPQGRVLYATRAYSGLPDYQLALVDPAGGAPVRVPLARAWEGAFSDDGTTLFFADNPPNSSHTKRYRGGYAQDIWSFGVNGKNEAVLLTGDFNGTSRSPMVHDGRVYFVSDRDGTMNLWSMTPQGKELTQHTHHVGWDVKDPDEQGGRIVYQLGADLHLYDIASGQDKTLGITLDSDFDQTRDRWITDPVSWITDGDISADGEQVVFTARGKLFVVPRKQGRIMRPDRDSGVRFRNAAFSADGKRILALGDESGEVEIWSLPPDGIGERKQLTHDATILRWQVVPSPDGRRLAHTDKNQELWLLDPKTGENRRIDTCAQGDFTELAWSPDGRYLAYVGIAPNWNRQIWLYDTETGARSALTTDRYEAFSPTWDPKGDWLGFLSDRNLHSLVRDVWGPRQPEPFFDRAVGLYLLSLRPGLVSPFAPRTELTPSEKNDEKKDEKEDGKTDEKKDKTKSDTSKDKSTATPVVIDVDGIRERLVPVPVEAGNYRALRHGDGRLFWMSQPDLHADTWKLMTLEISRDDPKPDTAVEELESFWMSADRKRFLLRKGKAFHVVDAGKSMKLEDETRLDLSGWSFPVIPRQEWRQMFVDAWRLERDYFYDEGMHGVDWNAMRAKYEPLVDRVADRVEFADLIGDLVSELTALHTYVYGGDYREGPDKIAGALLGARLEPAEGGVRVAHIAASDPDEPDRASPLARHGVDVHEGDVITAVNGVAVSAPADVDALLRNQAGKQVRLDVKPGGSGTGKPVVVEPISSDDDAELRYQEWEYTRRLEVDTRGRGTIGYVHLRAMGGDDLDRFARDYYPVFQRQGLIVDVRHNNGGNVESLILEKLSRKPWMYWQPRRGSPTLNMQYAFGGHLVLLVDERTVSDGEAFAEGFRRLGLGTLVGVRTLGGEIWLTSSNNMVDRGIATAAEFGVYGPEGEWLIENHGVEPDTTVVNLPHETFNGRDAQLEAAVDHLLRRIAEDPPRVPPPAPPYPDKSSEDNRRPR